MSTASTRHDPYQSPGRIAQARFTAALCIAALVFVAALVASALYELDRSRSEAQERAANEIDVLARVFAEHTRRSLQTVDTMLRSIADAERAGTLPPLDSRAMHDALAVQRDQFGDVAAVFVQDAQGNRLNSSTAYPPPAGSVVGSELVAGLQAGPRDAAYVGHPVRWLTTGRWAVPLARRLEGPGRAFDGVVGALLDSSYFDNFYAAIHLERGTAVALLHDGGALVSTFPRRDADVGRPMPAYRGIQEEAAWSPPVVLRGLAEVPERIAVARPVPGFAMTVVVSRDVGEVFKSWHEQVFWVSLRTGVLTLMMLALLLMVRRHVARVNAARAQLRESDQRYALAVAGSNEGLWDWNLVTGELFFSERAQQLCGLLPGPPLRKRRLWQARLLVHPEDLPRLREEMCAHLRGQRPHFDVEARAAVCGAGTSAAASGEPKWNWYRQRGLAIRDARGRPMRMAGSIENIDERKQSERQRAKLEAQLREAQKLEAIGTLAGGIAHDFNNILGAILGYGELARSGAETGSALARHLDAVMSAGLRAKALVERILAFSRSGIGERVPVHVQAVVAEATDLLLPSLPPGITLQRTLEAGDAAVIADATQIHQVVMNLCTHAIQAMTDGGTLTVSLELL
ncbi:MAG: sensor hybrid histidine kinase, partial [Ramlibacter sp.]|nr:sensor hybrid histidine kinase [Ramlibacter sp.]